MQVSIVSPVIIQYRPALMCSMFNSVHVRNHLFNLCPISIGVGGQSRSPSPFVRYRRRYTHEVYGTRSNMPNFPVKCYK